MVRIYMHLEVAPVHRDLKVARTYTHLRIVQTRRDLKAHQTYTRLEAVQGCKDLREVQTYMHLEVAPVYRSSVYIRAVAVLFPHMQAAHSLPYLLETVHLAAEGLHNDCKNLHIQMYLFHIEGIP